MVAGLLGRDRRRLYILFASCDRRRPDDDANEGKDTQHAERTARNMLVVDEDAAGDRERVRAERGKSRGCEGAAALETHLDDRERETVAGPDGQDDQEEETAAD